MKNEWAGLKVILWMFFTQRNNKGPVRYLGLPLIEWVLWAFFISLVSLFYWIVFRLFASMTYIVGVR